MFAVLSSYRVPILLAVLAACTTSIQAAGLNFTVGGTVTGLREVLVLQNNGGDDITVFETGAPTLAFEFATALPAGAIYNVTVKTQPFGQVCSVAKGVGKIPSANVTNVQVTCADIGAPRSIGGAVSGLTGSLILQNNGAETLTVKWRWCGARQLYVSNARCQRREVQRHGANPAFESSTDLRCCEWNGHRGARCDQCCGDVQRLTPRESTGRAQCP